MKRYIHFMSVLLLTVACAPTPAPVVQGPLDFDALIEAQINGLSQRIVTLDKVAVVGEVRSDSTLVPTATDWKAELDIFRQLGTINKTIYQGAYQQEGPLDDPQSNLHIQQYSSATSPLKVLKIYYQVDLQRVRKIEGFLEESTPLYSSQKNLTMVFDEENGKPVLTRYSIVGYQKVALRDTVRFTVESTITW
jgi:hypothetical protein